MTEGVWWQKSRLGFGSEPWWDPDSAVLESQLPAGRSQLQ